MKRLRISKLMDEYTDTEFFPTGGSAVSPERIKTRVLAQAMAAAPARRKQKMPRKKKVLLAAALAAALVLLTAAGYPFFQHLLINGELSFRQTADGRITSFVEYGPVMEAEEGRLYFVPEDGQRVDITDLAGEDTPYIYDGSDPEAGLTYYIIMGGTPDHYGWFTWVRSPNPFYESDQDPKWMMTTGFSFATSDGKHYSGLMAMADVEWIDDMDLPWLLTGAEQLGITFVNQNGES